MNLKMRIEGTLALSGEERKKIKEASNTISEIVEELFNILEDDYMLESDDYGPNLNNNQLNSIIEVLDELAETTSFNVVSTK